MANKKWLLLFAIIIFIYLVILQIYAIWPFTIDDMYISLRYAKHLANGQGLLWNINEPPVEGYSNFSFVMLATLAIKLNLNPVIVLKFVGLIGLLLLTFSIYLLTRLWFTPLLSCLPCLGVLVYRGQIIWSVSGFETTVYQALICFSLFALLKALGYRLYPKQEAKRSQLAFIVSGILLGLASLTRPEGPFFVILFYSIAWFDKKNNLNFYRKDLLIGILAFSTLYIPYFAWRLYYFGQLFPNPIYCKGLVDSYFGQIDKNYLKLAWPFFLLALPAIWQAQDHRHYYFWLPSVLYLLLLISADPIVAFENRLFLPAFVLLLPLSLKGLGEIIAYCLQDKGQSSFYQFALIIISILVGFSFIPILSLANLKYFTLNPQKGELLRKQVATWLEKNIASNSHVVLADSGLIPYYSSLAFIDSFCLNNKDMTTLPRKLMSIQGCEKIIKQKPEVIILTSLIEKKITYPSVDACLYNYIKLSKFYRFRIAFQTSESNPKYRYDIYTALH
ncbi:LphB [Legionella busanensis]|uniref:LphB n=1 Tax=Legionella busanensis TaxID=190655 RepID=A0A378JSL5_9GAMM|nr:protein LphB [Legionella busanensis]STX51162.1 LphB [Legionella busanensis]